MTSEARPLTRGEKTKRTTAYEVCTFANGNCSCRNKQARPCSATEKLAGYIIAMVRADAALSEEGR